MANSLSEVLEKVQEIGNQMLDQIIEPDYKSPLYRAAEDFSDAARCLIIALVKKDERIQLSETERKYAVNANFVLKNIDSIKNQKDFDKKREIILRRRAQIIRIVQACALAAERVYAQKPKSNNSQEDTFSINSQEGAQIIQLLKQTLEDDDATAIGVLLENIQELLDTANAIMIMQNSDGKVSIEATYQDFNDLLDSIQRDLHDYINPGEKGERMRAIKERLAKINEQVMNVVRENKRRRANTGPQLNASGI